METLFTITFIGSDSIEALEVFNRIKSQSEKSEDFELIAGILISKTKDGGLIIREAHNMGPEGTLSGSIVGALVNVLGGLPAQYKFHSSNSIFSSIPNTDKLDLSAYLAERVDKMIAKNTSAVIADVIENMGNEVMNSILSKYHVKIKKEDLLDAVEEQFLESMSSFSHEIEGLALNIRADKREIEMGNKIKAIEDKKEKLIHKLIKKIDSRKQVYRNSISNLELKKAKKNKMIIEKDVQRVEKKIDVLNKKEEELMNKISTLK